MDRFDEMEYYLTIIDVYYDLQTNRKSKNFGTISGWVRELDGTKHSQDNNLRDFVKYLIESGIIEEKGKVNNQHPYYQPNQEGAKQAQLKFEKLFHSMKSASKYFTLLREHNNGAFILDIEF